jgi:ABC-type sugar transport system ATPase subunit
MDDSIILKFKNITKTFPGVKALDNVSFDVKRGEVHVLLGENGAGKSTLIKILTGVFKQDSGSIYLNGQEIHISNILDSRALGIGTIFQENSLLPHLSVAENVFLTREIKNRLGYIDWPRMYDECRQWCGELGIDIDPGKKIKYLSVAQQQIVEIVKIFSQQPQIIILDEPTSALSNKEINRLFDIIVKMQAKGITFLYISHRLEELKIIGNRGSVLRDGKYISEMENVRTINRDAVIKLIVGRTLSEQYPLRDVKIGDEFFKVENLSISKTLYNVSFKVRKGEVVGLAGLVGSGRTSTAKAIFGAIRKTSGQIFVAGKEVIINSPIDAIRNKICLLPEDRKAEGLILNKPVNWNITFPSLWRYKKGIRLNKSLEKRDAVRYKDMLDIKTPSLDRLVKFLSGGNQQKVVFSKWLCAESQVYIFDEPTRGIDVGAKTEMYKIINMLAAKGNCVIVISSELPEILGICDRILVMYEGRITGEIDRKDASQEKVMYYAIGGDK